jgi:prevent-host-death family protein
MNSLTGAELKRRGFAAIEDGLRNGPLHIVKRNRPAAVVLTEEEYERLTRGKTFAPSDVSAVQWLLKQTPSGTQRKAALDAALSTEREAWSDA